MKKKYVKPRSTVVVVNADGRLMDISGVAGRAVTVTGSTEDVALDVTINNTASESGDGSNASSSWSDLDLSLSPRSNNIWDDDDW